VKLQCRSQQAAGRVDRAYRQLYDEPIFKSGESHMRVLAITIIALSTLTAAAYQEGLYICGPNNEYSYNIKSLDVAGTKLPYLEVTTTGDDHKVHSIKGIATHFTSSAGTEILALGNITLELKSGRPSCVKY
jgi:hypothetical protein